MATFLIVGGMPRSGTSILHKLLNTHPDIRLGFELRFFLYLNKKADKRLVLPEFWYHPYLSRPRRVQVALLFLRYLWLMLPFLWRKFDVEALRQTLQNFWPDKRYVGDKFPNYVYQIKRLSRIPDARIIIIYRECRDVVASFNQQAQTNWKNSDWIHNVPDIEAMARRWVQAIDVMEAHSDQILAIRYEDFVTQPDIHAQKIAEYLNVDVAGFDTSIIRDSSIGKYKESLLPEQITQIEAIAGHTMRRIGYEV